MNFKNLKFYDISLIKMATLSATLFLVSAWKGFADFATNTHWAWFLSAVIVFSIKPMMSVFEKKKGKKKKK